MRALRRLLQVFALVGTLLIGVVAVALIVSQTPWFRDWLRRYIVRESKQYLNGELSIGSLGGNLFFGVRLADVAVDVSGKRVVALRGLEVDYSVFRFISEGVVLDELKLIEPNLRLERTADGWNVGRLVKEQRKEADREGPARPISLQSIEIADGVLTIDDERRSSGYRLPEHVRDLDVQARFEYAPVHYSLELDRMRFRADSPTLTLQELKGKLAVRDDNLYFEDVQLETADSSVTIDGVIEKYLQTPIVKLTTTANVSLPEISRIVPAASGYALHPAIELKADGPAERLGLDLNVRSEAGNVNGRLTADVQAPNFAMKGRLNLQRLNLAPIVKNPRQRTDLTGEAAVDLKMASAPAAAPVLDRMSGTFSFSGPKVAAAGYEASNVRATGSLAKGRVTIDARANAYGGTATAAGTIVPAAAGRPLAFDLHGSARGVNLTRLPRATGAPAIQTDLSVAEYRVRGRGRSISGTARLNRSTIEGATLAGGTVAEFATRAGVVSYAARGAVSDVNLQRVGRALKVAALAKPELDSRVNGEFDVRGSGTRIQSMAFDATGTLRDTVLMGAQLPQMAFETHVAKGGLDATLKGSFVDLDPGRIARQERLNGQVTGSVDANVHVADLTAPITPESVAASGRLALGPSRVGDLQIDTAAVEGKYENRIGDLTRFELKGPDLAVNASGRLALDRESASSLKYHVEATDLAEVGRIAGQDGLAGSAVVDGTITGNAAALETSGSLNGSNLTYQKNNALDLNTTYSVHVPELTFADARIEATTGANFVKAGGLEINQITAKTSYAQKTLDFTTGIKEKTRELDATGRVIFHPDHQELHLPQLAIRTQGQEWRSAPDTEAAVRYGGNKLEMENVKLVSGDQTLAVKGTLALDGDDPASALVVEATNVDLAQLERLLMQDRGLSGRLTAGATVSGTTKLPIVDGHVEITNGGFRNYTYQSLAADLDYDGNRIELDAKLQQSPAEAITATGTVPMSLFRRSEAGHVAPTAEDRVDLRIKSTDIDLGIVQGFTNAVTNVTGTLQADVRVIGSGDDPHVQGSVTIRNGAFGVPLGGVSYSGLDTRIDLQEDLVRIQDFQILDEHGEALKVSGQLAVHERQVGAVDIKLQSDNFEVIDNELGDLGIDSALEITGELRRPRVDGEVRIEAGRLEVDQILQAFYDPYSIESRPAVVSAERTVEGAGSAGEATRQALAKAHQGATPPPAEKVGEPEEPAPGGAFAPVSLNVRVRMPDNLVLRGNDLRPGGPTRAALGDMNITVGGDVTVRKEPNGPVAVSGVVNTVRGTYEFQGRRFDLVRGGTLRFVGDPSINPMLDVSATRMIPNTGVEARIHITGTVQAPELRLASNPPLEESDVLALIVFNRPVNELGSGERSSLAATAGGIATGFIAAPLGESIGRALDLDLFEITTTSESGELGAGVTIGQQFGDRMFVKLRQEFGDRNVSEFLLEYRLASFLRLRGSAAPETTGSANRIGQRRVERAGLDLIFFFSY